MGIRSRTILIILAANFTIILIGILAGAAYVRRNIESYIETDMLVVADIADRFISSELDMLRHEAATAASRLAMAAPGEWAGILAESVGAKFIGFAVMNRNGAIAASAGAAASPNLLEHESVQAAFEGRMAFTSTIPSVDAVAFHLAVPIDGTVEYILILTLDGLYFSKLTSDYTIWKTGHIFIDDRDGYIIANNRPEWVQNRQNFLIKAQDDPQYEDVASVIKKVTAGDRGIGYYSMNGISRICAYRPISGSEEGWVLGIVAPLSESPVGDVDRGLLIIAFVCILLNIVAALIAAGFIKKPFEELAAMREAAEADSRAKSTFLAHMSHEIRTPLNTVVGLSELALGDGGQDEETVDRLEKIRASGLTILGIVNDILDISKIEAGKFELLNAAYDTPSLVNDVVTLNIVSIGERPVTFRLKLDETLPAILHGDNLRVKQIFNNLLSNAFKYTNSGEVEWSVSHESDQDGFWLISSIQDTGIGIKSEDLDKLFSDYNRVNMEANRQVEGTGLGLAITRRLVEKIGGSLTVASEYGRGTTFKVRLRQGFVAGTPIGREVADNLMGLRYMLSKRAKSETLIRPNLSYARVLVVDDIATNLEVVKGMMKPYSLKVDCVTSGAQAIDLIRAGEPCYSAVFMDHMMPNMDGLEATRIIRKEIGTMYANNIPIIALTANAIVGNKEMFLNNGFQDFISKPIDTIKLDSVLRRWVRDKKLEQDLPAKEVAAPPKKGSEETLLKGIAIKGLDMKGTLKRFSGDEGVIIEVLRSYATATGTILGNMKECLDGERLADYAIAVHGIKGSSYGICAREVASLAEALEKAARAGNLPAVRAGHETFEKTAEKLIKAIDGTLTRIKAADKPTAKAPNPELLRQLHEAVISFDMDRIDAIMADLEALRYESEPGRELMAWLREQIDNMTFEAISKLSTQELLAWAGPATDSQPEQVDNET